MYEQLGIVLPKVATVDTKNLVDTSNAVADALKNFYEKNYGNVENFQKEMEANKQNAPEQRPAIDTNIFDSIFQFPDIDIMDGSIGLPADQPGLISIEKGVTSQPGYIPKSGIHFAVEAIVALQKIAQTPFIRIYQYPYVYGQNYDPIPRLLEYAKLTKNSILSERAKKIIALYPDYTAGKFADEIGGLPPVHIEGGGGREEGRNIENMKRYLDYLIAWHAAPTDNKPEPPKYMPARGLPQSGGVIGRIGREIERTVKKTVDEIVRVHVRVGEEFLRSQKKMLKETMRVSEKLGVDPITLVTTVAGVLSGGLLAPAVAALAKSYLAGEVLDYAQKKYLEKQLEKNEKRLRRTMNQLEKEAAVHQAEIDKIMEEIAALEALRTVVAEESGSEFDAFKTDILPTVGKIAIMAATAYFIGA